MNQKIGIKQVVAIGIGTALFAVLTMVQVPLGFIPNTSLQVRMAVLAFFSAVFGPVVGGLSGILGHALGDAIFYGSVWWSWVFPEAVVGVGIGLFMKKLAVEEGEFKGSKLLLFNIVQVVANALAWIVIYTEPANKVFLQGVFAFIGNIIIIGILGTLLLVVYSQIKGSSSGLKKED